MPGCCWQRLRSNGTTAGRLELPRGKHLLRLLAPADRLQAVELRSRTPFQVAEAGKVSSLPQSGHSHTGKEVWALHQTRGPAWPGVGHMQMAAHVAGAGLPANMLKGKPCACSRLAGAASICSCTAGAVQEQRAGLIWTARLLMLPAYIAGAGREGGPVPAGRRGAHASAAGRHLAAVLQVSLWHRQGPLGVPAVCMPSRYDELCMTRRGMLHSHGCSPCS